MKNQATPDLESRTGIRKAAFRLFRTSGYKDTSYSMIAEESGCGRPLVQYHYPKKESFALEFIVEAMDLIDKMLSASEYDDPDATVRITRFGQIYYGFLLYDENMKRFTRELLADRSISSQIVAMNAEATLSGLVGEEAVQRTRAASIKATGGVYELLYLELLRDGELPPEELSVQNMAAFLSFIGAASYEDACADLKQQILPQKALEEFEENLFRQLLD